MKPQCQKLWHDMGYEEHFDEVMENLKLRKERMTDAVPAIRYLENYMYLDRNPKRGGFC